MLAVSTIQQLLFYVSFKSILIFIYNSWNAKIDGEPVGNICALYTKFGEHGSWGTNFGGKLGYGSTSAVWGTHFGGKNYGELWPTSSFACLAWTQVPHNGEQWPTSSFACIAWTQVPHNGELWPTSRFACIAWTQVPHNGELTFWAVIMVPHMCRTYWPCGDKK